MAQSIPASLINGDPAYNSDPDTAGRPSTAANLGGANTGGSCSPGIGIGTGNSGNAPQYPFSEPAAPGSFKSDQIAAVAADGTTVPADALPDAVNSPTRVMFAVEYNASPPDFNDTLWRNIAAGTIAPDASEDGIFNRSSEDVLVGESYHGTVTAA